MDQLYLEQLDVEDRTATVRFFDITKSLTIPTNLDELRKNITTDFNLEN
jgi:hypothetical protein